MFKLVIADDEGKTTVVPLVREEISIGRKEGNTIRLTERNVSRKHARLRRANGSFLIEDLSSFNGVKVNGRKIGGELELSAGDQITIGDYQLALQVEGTTDAGATMPDTTAPNLMASGASTEVTAMIAAPMGGMTPARLVMLSPPAPGQEFALNRPRMKLGRAEDLDVWVNHRSISREHAEFIVDGDRFAVTDLGSANGLRVNGVETKRHELRSGDVIEIGQVKLRFVAPGETFVFDEGRTMQMDALSDLGPASPNRTPMYIGGGIVVLALLGGLGVAMSGGGEDPGPTVTAIPTVATVAPPAVAPPAVGSVPGTVPSPGTPAAPVGIDVAGAVAACRTALNSGDFEGALTQANLALSAAPADPGATACRDAVTNQRAESDAFANGLASLRSGDLQGAYVAFESLPEASTYRNRAEFSQVMHDFAEENLRTAESLVGSDANEASRLAQMVLTMSVVEPSARARAEAVVRRARPHVASGGGGSRGSGGGGPVRVPGGGGGGGGGGGSSGSGGATAVSSGGGGGGAATSGGGGGGGGGGVEATAPTEPGRYDTARACAIAGDHSCVIRELRGHCTTARDYELLIGSMRASTGYDREVESSMRAYLTRFPAGRQAAQYRQYLVAHSGG